MKRESRSDAIQDPGWDANLGLALFERQQMNRMVMNRSRMTDQKKKEMTARQVGCFDKKKKKKK